MVCAVGLFSSCGKDFLEVVPKGVAIAKKTSDYELLLNDRNLTFLQRAPQVVMSDEIAGFSPLYTIGSGLSLISDKNAFEYKDDIYLPTENMSELTQLEKQLYSYNKVINEVMDAEGNDNRQKSALRAEALAGRAWAHFMLVNYYGKPYNKATAASDLGIPLVTVADVTQNMFKRSTIQEAYDLIIADLREAIPNLTTQVVSRHRMSRSAAEAILGKVYVYMQQFEQALPLLESSLANLHSNSLAVGLYDFNKELSSGGAFYPISPFTGPNRLNLDIDKEVLYLKSYLNTYTLLLSGLPLTGQTAALYSAADLRQQFMTALPFPPTMVYPGGMKRCYGKYSNVGVNVSDIYLLKAECEARGGQLSAATSTLEAFRLSRMNNKILNAEKIPVSIAADKILLTKFILEERIREFAGSGERWWDMRRLIVDDQYKSTVGLEHHVYDATGKLVQSFPLKVDRLVLRFPQYVMNANPDLQQNP
jgi:tetratricopeptide (TPR) repeat protein